MNPLAFLLTFLFAPDVDRLGHPDWLVREEAESRLKAWGLLAVPELIEGLKSASPEVRLRADSILKRWRSLAADLRAAAFLLDPWPVNAFDFWSDDALRVRLYRLCKPHKIPVGTIEWFLVPSYRASGWGWWTMLTQMRAALYRAREHLGVESPWPFGR